MRPEVEIAPLQRITAVAVKIKLRAAGHKNLLAGGGVVKSFEKISPATVIVDFVEELCARGWQFAFENGFPMRRDIEIHVGPGVRNNHLPEPRLVHLLWTTHEYHLAREVAHYDALNVSDECC